MPHPPPTASLYTETGRRIRDIRKKKGISQEGLATAVGLSRTSITNIECGRQKVLLHTLESIAHALDVELHDLIPDRRVSTSRLEEHLPADVSPNLRRFILRLAEKKGAPK